MCDPETGMWGRGYEAALSSETFWHHLCLGLLLENTLADRRDEDGDPFLILLPLGEARVRGD